MIARNLSQPNTPLFSGKPSCRLFFCAGRVRLQRRETCFALRLCWPGRRQGRFSLKPRQEVAVMDKGFAALAAIAVCFMLLYVAILLALIAGACAIVKWFFF